MWHIMCDIAPCPLHLYKPCSQPYSQIISPPKKKQNKQTKTKKKKVYVLTTTYGMALFLRLSKKNNMIYEKLEQTQK